MELHLRATRINEIPLAIWDHTVLPATRL